MKKTFLSLIAAALLWSGCDNLENPYSYVKYRYMDEKYGPAPTFTFEAGMTKNVLVEEFTGHLCGFCPKSTKLVNELDSVLGERMVTVSIHAGSLAQVSAPPFDTDYRNAVSNLYWGQLQGGFNPCARIDRQGGVSNFLWLDADNPNSWIDIIQAAKNESPKAAVQLQADFVAEDNVINIHTASQFNENMSGQYALVVLLVESHIISAQEDYDQTPSEILEYEHKHVLRDAVTQAMGNFVVNQPKQGDVFAQSFTYPLPSNWMGENMTVVAYLIDQSSNEVVNSSEYELD
jgi:hypothetical protein